MCPFYSESGSPASSPASPLLSSSSPQTLLLEGTGEIGACPASDSGLALPLTLSDTWATFFSFQVPLVSGHSVISTQSCYDASVAQCLAPESPSISIHLPVQCLAPFTAPATPLSSFQPVFPLLTLPMVQLSLPGPD